MTATDIQLEAGPTGNLPDSGRAIDFYALFFDDELIEDIVRFMNKNAEAKGARNWNAVTPEEMKAFLAFLMISNDMLVVPRDERYFLSSLGTKIFHVPGVKKIFPSRKRLFELKSYTFFVDPEHILTEEERKDSLYKVRHVITSVVNKCKTLFRCAQEISINDEAMIPFKRKLAIKVRMPDKPVKFGVKCFELCDAKTGYCKNLIMYAGKDDRETGSIGKTGRVVMELVQDLYHTNHHLYMDNFYNSPILFKLLKTRGIQAAGTARPRKGYPNDELKAFQLKKRGEVAWLTWERMTALRWKDKKDVFFLSSIHAPPKVPDWVGREDAPKPDPDAEPNPEPNPDVVSRRVKVRGQWKTLKIYRPKIVEDYNKFMGGVDLCDQMTAVNKSKKQRRWYLRVFIKLLLIAIHNAYILEGFKVQHVLQGKRKRDLLQFKEELCLQLVGNYPSTHKQSAASKRQRNSGPHPERMQNVGMHIPFKGEGSNHHCAVCEKRYSEAKKRGQVLKRHKTTFKCGQCNVYLCVGSPGENCF